MNNFFENLVEIPYTQLYTKLLFTALDLKVFDFLKESKTSKELADELNLHLDNCEYFLNGLYSLGYLTKNDSKFQNVKDTDKYLTTDSEYYFGDVLRVSTKINNPEKIDFKSMLENGPSHEMMGNADISFDEMYADMKDSQSGIRAREIKDIVCNLKEYPNIKRILDIGCGAGLLGMSVISSRDDITGVLFDKPPMGNLINSCVKEKGLEDKVEVKLGDYIQDDIGENYDLIMAIGTLNFAKYTISQVLKKIYNSLTDDGVFLAVLDEVNKEFSQPKEFVVSWLPYVLNGMDIYLIEDFVKNVGIEVGFKDIEVSKELLAFGHFNVITFRK